MMNDFTADALNRLNQTFYAQVGESFDATRGQAWRGWQPLLQYLHAPLTVLDIGCGNGRFALFLAESLPEDAPIRYIGVDSSAYLLDRARESCEQHGRLQTQFIQGDIVSGEIPEIEADCVALFGVLHHIPGRDRRLALVQTLAKRVRPGGILAFACWRFYEYERFRKHLQPMPEGWQVEAGDYLLNWGKHETALRYCHYADDAEIAELVKAAGLNQIAAYRADGFSNAINAYRLLRRESPPSVRRP
ncbi:MAG: methyltransferase domain-containing protein [Anaerolineae bacterium]|nr:methyltransferase domain-containing protein [Anaerolineae bacterium]